MLLHACLDGPPVAGSGYFGTPPLSDVLPQHHLIATDASQNPNMSPWVHSVLLGGRLGEVRLQALRPFPVGTSHTGALARLLGEGFQRKGVLLAVDEEINCLLPPGGRTALASLAPQKALAVLLGRPGLFDWKPPPLAQDSAPLLGHELQGKRGADLMGFSRNGRHFTPSSFRARCLADLGKELGAMPVPQTPNTSKPAQSPTQIKPIGFCC